MTLRPRVAMKLQSVVLETPVILAIKLFDTPSFRNVQDLVLPAVEA